MKNSVYKYTPLIVLILVMISAWVYYTYVFRPPQQIQVDYVIPIPRNPYGKVSKNHAEYVYDRSDRTYFKTQLELERGFKLPLVVERIDDPLPPTPPPTPTPIINIDAYIRQNLGRGSQNVHDTCVQNTVKQKYLDISKEAKKSDSHMDYIEGIQQYAKDIGKDVSDVIKHIQDRNASLYNFAGQKEMDVLTNTWKTAEDDNVKHQIINELVDCRNSYGSIYCPTGVATRIVNATFVNDPDKMGRTKEVIHTEMMNIAVNLRNTQEADGTYDDERFKKDLVEKYKKDYEGILTHDKIDDMVKDWIQFV